MLAADAPLLSATSLPLNYCSKALNRSRAVVLVSRSIHRRTYGSVGGAVVAAACARAPVSFRSLVVALYSTPPPCPSHAVVSYASLFYYEGLSLSARSETDLISASQPATRARRTALLCCVRMLLHVRQVALSSLWEKNPTKGVLVHVQYVIM